MKNGQLLIKNARIAYPKLYTPEGIKGDPTSKPRYGCQIMIPKKDVKTKAAIDSAFGMLIDADLKGKRPKSTDLCLKDGDGPDADASGAGHWILSANRSESQRRPQVVDRDGRTPIDSQDTKVYAGCVCNFLVSFFCPKNWPKICASLEIVQFVADGEPLGRGTIRAQDVMPDISDDDSDDY